MSPYKRVLSFRLLKSSGFFQYYSGSDKRKTRAIVSELNRVFIPKKVNEEFD
jgi:hypothetical protein